MFKTAMWTVLGLISVAPVFAQTPPPANPPGSTVSATTGTVPASHQMSVTVPVIRWSNFRGLVTHVNQAQSILELKLKDGTRLGIPYVANTVGIYKKDHRFDLKDIRDGDEVEVRNLAGGY